MLKKISRSLTYYMIDNKVISYEDEEVYVYGWSLLLSTLGNFIVMFLVGAYLEKLFETILFTLFFCILRNYAGGYHADSYGSCFIVTMVIYSIAPLLDFFLPIAYIDLTLAILLVAAVVVTWVWAPIDHPNKPLNDLDKLRNKKISRYIVLGQVIVILFVWLWQPGLKQSLLWAGVGMAATSFSLLYVIYHPYQKGGEI